MKLKEIFRKFDLVLNAVYPYFSSFPRPPSSPPLQNFSTNRSVGRHRKKEIAAKNICKISINTVTLFDLIWDWKLYGVIAIRIRESWNTPRRVNLSIVYFTFTVTNVNSSSQLTSCRVCIDCTKYDSLPGNTVHGVVMSSRSRQIRVNSATRRQMTHTTLHCSLSLVLGAFALTCDDSAKKPVKKCKKIPYVPIRKIHINKQLLEFINTIELLKCIN